ncbi:MAG TPA: hypothetical protein VGE97_09300 [Nitrososphaera sp.]
MSETTYVSRGAEEVPPEFTNELGSALSLQLRDMIPTLANRPQALRQYDYMNRTDAVVSVSLRAGKTPIQSADFYIDPIGEDQQAEDIADFVHFNLFENLTSPWQYVLSRVLKMYQHGSAVIEPVYTTGLWSPHRSMANRKRYNLLKKLAYRPGPTIDRIEYDDNGGPMEIYQNALRGDGKSEEVIIPIEKAIIFSIGDSDDYLGESLLRTAYPHWYYKTHLYKVDAIQKERHGIGVPVGKLPPGFRATDKDAMNELLSNLRTNERSFITLPPGYEIEFAEIHTNLVDVLGSANHHDILIMLNVFAEFMMLGLETSGGGRATSGSQTDLFYKSVWYIAEAVADYFNMFLIPKLVLFNFETDVLPQMKVRNIGQARDMQQGAAALANLFHNNILTPDIETEQYIRKLFDIPLKKSKVQTPITTGSPPFSGDGGSAPTADISANGGQGNVTKGPTQA